MSSFLLLHGGFHGAWCWEPLIGELKRRGHAAYALDLPGHGSDASDRRDITRQSYVQAIGKFIRHLDLQDLIIVGHSLAGAVLPEVYLSEQGRISALVFLAGLVLSEGESPMDLIPAERRPGYYAMAEQSSDNSFMVSKERAREIFFNDLSDAESERNFHRLTPQPFGVYVDPTKLSPKLEDVLIRYILCRQDKTLPRELCLQCAEKLCVDVEEIDAGHDVMLSKPEDLAELLLAK